MAKNIIIFILIAKTIMTYRKFDFPSMGYMFALWICTGALPENNYTTPTHGIISPTRELS